MGAGIHSVLQKKDDSGNWNTIDTDVIQFTSSTVREFSSEVAPKLTRFRDANLDSNGNYKLPDGSEHYLGEYGYCMATVKELLHAVAELEIYHEPEQITFERVTEGYEVFIRIPESEVLEFGVPTIKAYAQGLALMYWEPDNYRLIIGFDS